MGTYDLTRRRAYGSPLWPRYHCVDVLGGEDEGRHGAGADTPRYGDNLSRMKNGESANTSKWPWLVGFWALEVGKHDLTRAVTGDLRKRDNWWGTRLALADLKMH